MQIPDLFGGGRLPIGIDIGASGVKLLQLSRRGRSSLTAVAAARAELPEPAEGPASDAHLNALAGAVKDRVERGGFRGRACVVSLDPRLLRIRSVRHPRMPDDELDRAVRLDAPTRLGFGESEPCETGWYRAGEVRHGDDSRDEIILVGAPSGPVERLVSALSESGLRPLAVEPGFAGCARGFARFLRRAADQSVVKIIVDIGQRSTGVTIIRGQEIAFHKPVEIGGEAMTRSAAERLGLDPGAVLDLRRQRMSGASAPTDPRVDRAIFEAVRPTMVDLANEVSLCLRYFGVSFRGSRPDACLVVGGDAGEPRLVEIMNDALHLPVSVGHPLEGVEVPERVARSLGWSDAPWSVAAGLSLRAMRGVSARPSERRRGAPEAAPAASGSAGGGAASRRAAA